MVKNPEVVEYPPNGQLLGDVVGVVEHHIRVLGVPMKNLWEHPTETKCIHARRRNKTKENRYRLG